MGSVFCLASTFIMEKESALDWCFHAHIVADLHFWSCTGELIQRFSIIQKNSNSTNSTNKKQKNQQQGRFDQETLEFQATLWIIVYNPFIVYAVYKGLLAALDINFHFANTRFVERLGNYRWVTRTNTAKQINKNKKYKKVVV